MFSRFLRYGFVVILAAVLGVTALPAASARSGAGSDVAVKLSATGSLLLAGARYTVTITNNGPEPLNSATVVLQVDPRAFTTSANTACPFDIATDTFTCTFGPVPPGGTAQLGAFVYFHVQTERATLVATATRTASTPADPNAANDSDPATCWYRHPIMGQPWPPPTTCEVN